MAIECPQCFEMNRDEARKCGRCGAALPKPERRAQLSVDSAANRLREAGQPTGGTEHRESDYRFALMVAASYGYISKPARQLLEARRMALGIAPEVAQAIEAQVMQDEAGAAGTPAVATQPEQKQAGARVSGLLCPGCGIPFAAGSSHCAACGFSLEGECPGCGGTVRLGLSQCPTCSADVSRLVDFVRLFNEARQLRSEAQLESALASVQGALEIVPGHREAGTLRNETAKALEYYREQRAQALAAWQQQDYREAGHCLSEALRLAPHDAQLQQMQEQLPALRQQAEAQRCQQAGEAALALGDAKQAVRVLEEGLQYSPNDPVLRSLLERARETQHGTQIQALLVESVHALQAGKFDDADALCQQVLALDSKHDRAHQLLVRIEQTRSRARQLWYEAEAAWDKEDWAHADQCLMQLVKLQPDHPQALSRKREIDAMPARLAELLATAREKETQGRYWEASQAMADAFRISHDPEHQRTQERLSRRRKGFLNRMKMTREAGGLAVFILSIPWLLVKFLFDSIIWLLAFCGDLFGAGQGNFSRKMLSALIFVVCLIAVTVLYDWLRYVYLHDMLRDNMTAAINDATRSKDQARLALIEQEITNELRSRGGFVYWGKSAAPWVIFVKVLMLFGVSLGFMWVCSLAVIFRIRQNRYFRRPES